VAETVFISFTLVVKISLAYSTKHIKYGHKLDICQTITINVVIL